MRSVVQKIKLHVTGMTTSQFPIIEVFRKRVLSLGSGAARL